MADGYVVEAAGVTKRFRDSRGGELLTAVDCLDIRAVRGKMTALIGPDGAEDDIPSNGLRADVSN